MIDLVIVANWIVFFLAIICSFLSAFIYKKLQSKIILILLFAFIYGAVVRLIINIIGPSSAAGSWFLFSFSILYWLAETIFLIYLLRILKSILNGKNKE